MPLDHVRFCEAKYLRYSHAYHPAEGRPDDFLRTRRLNILEKPQWSRPGTGRMTW